MREKGKIIKQVPGTINIQKETIEKAKSKIRRETKRIMKKEEGLTELQA